MPGEGTADWYSDIPETPKYVGNAALTELIVKVKQALATKQDNLTIDSSVTSGSNNPVSGGAVYTALTGNGISSIANMGLSQENFTTTLKTKLDGIATGAQVNVIESIKSGNTTFSITNKVVDIQAVDNLTNYYTTSNTYTKSEVNTLIEAIPSIQVTIVSELPTASETTYFNESKTVYMVRNTASTGTDYYEEYITVRTGTSPSYSYSWEKIGDTQIDLSNYVQKTTTIAGVDLQDNITKSELLTALNVADGAEVNVQADWNQTNTSADDYIKNKPTIPTDTNQKIKTSSVTFGNDDVVEIVAGNNVSVAGDATNKTITIAAEDGITQITSNTNVWELENGIYQGQAQYFRVDSVHSIDFTNATICTVIKTTAYKSSSDQSHPCFWGFGAQRIIFGWTSQTESMYWDIQLNQLLKESDIVDNLTTSLSYKVLSAKQGYILDTNKVDLYTVDNTDWDTTPTANSTKPVTSGGIKTALDNKLDKTTVATSSALGLIKLGSDTAQSVAAEAVSSTANRTYAIQLNSSNQAVVNVPWVNTTYSSLAAVASGTDVSLCTTGEKYIWNSKQNALPTDSTGGKLLASTTTAGTVEWMDEMTASDVDTLWANTSASSS